MSNLKLNLYNDSESDNKDCSEESSKSNAQSDDIPPITYRKLNSCNVQREQILQYNCKKIVKLFISDILNSECSSKKSFKVKGLEFRSVMICGTVVGTHNYSDEKHIITVDDGTGQIDCFLANDPKVESLKEMVDEDMGIKNVYKKKCGNKLLQASLMLLNNAKHTLSELPYFRDFSVGNTVQLIAGMSDYKDKRYLFVNGIVKLDVYGTDFIANYLNNLYYLYECIYNK